MTADSKQNPPKNPADGKPAEGILYVGIDLGTSRTAVAASNGVRDSTASFVGYPKDVVSRKALGRDVLYGEDALQNRLSLNLYRPLAKGVIQFSDDKDGGDKAAEYSKAATDLVRHSVGLAQPRADELVYAVIGCPAEASVKNKKAILEAARAVVDSAMICSEPFAVAYGLDRFMDTLVVDIGAGTTDLCRMHGTLPAPEDQRSHSFAGDHVDVELMRLLEETCEGAQFTVHGVAQIKERYGYVGENQDPIVVDLPVGGKPTPFDLTTQIRTACRTILPPTVEAIRDLIASFDPDFQVRLKNNVLVGGGGSQMHGLGSALEAEMHERLGGGRVLVVEEPVYAGANGALKTAHDMPAEFWEQLR